MSMSVSPLCASDLVFLREKMKHAQQLRASVSPTKQDGIDELFKAYRVLFDEVIEHLPASGTLLAKIKHEYETAIATIQFKGQESRVKQQRDLVKSCEVETISNHHKRIKQLDFNLNKIRLDSKRMKDEMSQMRSEIETVLLEKERQRELLKVSAPRMSSTKRRSLGLRLEDATSLNQLEKELQNVREELIEVKIVAEKKYIPGERKVHLRKLLKEKEDAKIKLDESNSELALQLKRIKLATQAVATYQSYLHKHQLDPSTLTLDHYINAVVIESNCEDVSDEEPDDPAKEMEAEMVLDCFEKFNELFEGERYEEAALHAASSPKGVLRTMDTLNKFKYSARHSADHKLPLLCYCEHLMQCAPAHRPLSLEESMECVQCALDNDGISLITHWIAQGVLYPSLEVGKLLMKHCQCSDRCFCGCKKTAFSVLDKCGEHKLAALCLVHQEKFMGFLSFAKKINLSKNDYMGMLLTSPGVGFAKVLVCPPMPYEPIMTVYEAADVLLQGGMGEEVATLLTDVANRDHLHAVTKDNITSWDVWQSLITNLHKAGLSELAIEFLLILTVKKALQDAMNSVVQEPGYVHGDCVQSFPQCTNSSFGRERSRQSSYSSSECTDSESDSSSGGYSSEVESESLLH